MRVRRLVSGDMTLGQGHQNVATGDEAVVQKVRSRLRVVRGEWFLDTSVGIPYWPTAGNTGATFADRPAPLSLVEAEIKTCILDTVGVASLDSFSVSLDRNTRALTVNASGTLEDASEWSIQETVP